MHRPWVPRTVAPEAGDRSLSPLVSHPAYLTIGRAVFLIASGAAITLWAGPIAQAPAKHSLWVEVARRPYVSYCGRYDYLGDRVVHHVQMSLFPNWIGGDQERLVDLRGNRLTLSTRPLLLRGIQQTAHLIWERVSTSEQ
jgi:hypothetical protein